MGWCRFQTVPIFTSEDKFTKYLKNASYSDVVFYGPSVSAGTSFFLFNLTGEYRILASGQILD